jgi:hypothetical protein
VNRFPTRVKPAHYRGTYHARSRALVAAAYANPDTRCWRCGLRLHECKPHRNGRPAKWTAGHLNDGEVNGPLAPECSPCAVTSGARLGNWRSRQRRALNASRQW